VKIAVVGLWHLGTVTAGCLAAAGHTVIAIDEDAQLISALEGGTGLPVGEPGLAGLLRDGIAARTLRFTCDRAQAAGCDAVWITYDTPVSENDVADVDFVFDRAAAMLKHMRDGAILVVSSQMPVGSMARLERWYAEQGGRDQVDFVYSPENLRLGKAIEVFRTPDRVVVGVRPGANRDKIAAIWAPFTDRLVWMSVESAEMAKHALNAFLATSIVFINEIAVACEHTGADALEVERGLKSDVRIGPGAYLHAGGAFSGGTLARDVEFLRALADGQGFAAPLIQAVKESNDLHKDWIARRLREHFRELQGRRLAVLGLTYKPGTDTLRRSASVEVCRRLAAEGATLRAFDPAVANVPSDVPVQIAGSAREALTGADAAIVATPWPEFASLSAHDFLAMRTRVVIDPMRHLERTLAQAPVIYLSIGRGNAALG
jgi:UDPglucose 6-dehydrogenase